MTHQKPVETLRANAVTIGPMPAGAHVPLASSADRHTPTDREILLRRIRAEFEEMPGLSVTLEQAMRLFGLSRDAMSRILVDLTGAHVLQVKAERRYSLRRSA